MRSTALVIVAVIAVVVALVITAIATVAGLAWYLALPVGLLFGLGAGTAFVLPRLRGADEAVLALFPGSPADRRRHARLLNLVDGLRHSIGMAEPEVRILDDPAANAMTVAAGDRVTLVITQGLLDRLDRMELEGVVAELLVRAKRGDAEVGTAASSFIGGLFIDGPLRPLRSYGLGRLERLLPEDRDLQADFGAVGVTRYPPGLAAALTKMATAGHRPAASNPRTDHLWLAPPDDALVPSYPLELRIDVLEEI